MNIKIKITVIVMFAMILVTLIFCRFYNRLDKSNESIELGTIETNSGISLSNDEINLKYTNRIAGAKDIDIDDFYITSLEDYEKFIDNLQQITNTDNLPQSNDTIIKVFITDLKEVNSPIIIYVKRDFKQIFVGYVDEKNNVILSGTALDGDIKIEQY